MCNIVLTSWLEDANINIDDIIKILKINKSLSSMEIFCKMKEMDSSVEQKFAQFSKLLCDVLPREKIVYISKQMDGSSLYTIPKIKKEKNNG